MDNTAQNQVNDPQSVANNFDDVTGVAATTMTVDPASVNNDLLATQLSPSQAVSVPTQPLKDDPMTQAPMFQDQNLQGQTLQEGSVQHDFVDEVQQIPQTPQTMTHPQFGENIQPVGRMAKEEEPIGMAMAESAPVVEAREMEVPHEVSEYVKEEKKENLELLEKIEHQGQTLVAPSVQNDLPEIVLPMTKTSFDKSMPLSVVSSARWLAEWCFRIVKKFHGRVVYAQSRE